MRQRLDGTFTSTTPEWDRKWYWPVGTRVRTVIGRGVVIKQNAVSVWIRLESGDVRRNVPVAALTRIED